MAKGKELLAKKIPAKDIDKMVKSFEKLGATDIKKTKNTDGTFNLEGTFED